MFRKFHLQLLLNLTNDIKTEIEENRKYKLPENLFGSNCNWIENSENNLLNIKLLDKIKSF